MTLAVDPQAAIARLTFRHGDAGLRLEKKMLDVLRAIGVFKNESASAERFVHVAALQDGATQLVTSPLRVDERCVGFERGMRISDRGPNVVADVNQFDGLTRKRLCVCNHAGDAITGATSLFALGDKDRPIARNTSYTP